MKSAPSATHVGRQVRARTDRRRRSPTAPCGVSRVAQLADRVDRAEHVRHRGEAERLRPVEQLIEIGEVEQPLGGQRHPAQDDAALGREDVPGDDVRVVLHVGEHDDVAFAQVRAAPGVRDEVEALGRVLREDHFTLARRVDEPLHLQPRGLVGLGRLGRDLVHAAVHVRVARLVVALHRVEHLPGLLRGRRRVEVDETRAVDHAVEDREVLLDPSDVETCVHSHELTAMRRTPLDRVARRARARRCRRRAHRRGCALGRARGSREGAGSA